MLIIFDFLSFFFACRLDFEQVRRLGPKTHFQNYLCGCSTSNFIQCPDNIHARVTYYCGFLLLARCNFNFYDSFSLQCRNLGTFKLDLELLSDFLFFGSFVVSVGLLKFFGEFLN